MTRGGQWDHWVAEWPAMEDLELGETGRTSNTQSGNWTEEGGGEGHGQRWKPPSPFHRQDLKPGQQVRKTHTQLTLTHGNGAGAT